MPSPMSLSLTHLRRHGFLAGLVNAGRARWVEGETPARGGRRPMALELLPTSDTSDTRPP